MNANKNMKNLQNFVTSLHQATNRDYIERMMGDKVKCMKIAKEFGVDYWDGDRKYGYGGYKYIPGYWEPVARQLIKKYKLVKGSKVLDVGCGKGFLLSEMLLLEPGLKVIGFDISEYAISCAQYPVKPLLFKHLAQDVYPFDNNEFDLVISLGTLHNLPFNSLNFALSEIQRVGRVGYIMVESFRNDLELFNLQCWALTCQSFFSFEQWIHVFENSGYLGDYEFIYFS
jgi:SAM-dependent methyltransferase